MKTMGIQTNDAGKPWRVLISAKIRLAGRRAEKPGPSPRTAGPQPVEPRVIVSNCGWLTDKLDELRVPWSLVRFGHWINFASLPRNLLLIARLKKYIRQHGIQLVHANEHWIAPPCIGPRAGRECRPSAISDRPRRPHAAPDSQVSLRPLGPRHRRGGSLREALAKEISDPEKIVVVRDGVEPFPGEPATGENADRASSSMSARIRK